MFAFNSVVVKYLIIYSTNYCLRLTKSLGCVNKYFWKNIFVSSKNMCSSDFVCIYS